MYRLVFKEPGDRVWRYDEWVENYEPVLKKYKLIDFFVENEHRMIIYSK